MERAGSSFGDPVLNSLLINVHLGVYPPNRWVNFGCSEVAPDFLFGFPVIR